MQVGAKECLVSKQDLQINGLKMVLERSNILVTETAKGMKNVIYILSFFNSFVNVNICYGL